MVANTGIRLARAFFCTVSLAPPRHKGGVGVSESMLNGTRWPNDRSTLRPRDDPKKLTAGVGDAWLPTLENTIWGVRGVMVRDAIPR